MMFFYLAVFATSFLAVSSDATAVRKPSTSECQKYAKSGFCVSHGPFMKSFCWSSCEEEDRKKRDGMIRTSLNIENDITAETEFFDLKAKDIDGNNFDFGSLRGKVTLVTNVASYCGLTDEHYNSLMALHEQIPEGLEILAFPCNQFGNQEPDDPATIKKFAINKGVQFSMMEKINVNGYNTHPVYNFLKAETDRPGGIKWNFGTYYIIGPTGDTYWYDNRKPLDLKDHILELLYGAE
mmetsp:Transcript_35889/g.55204  ORF Transcript_35889/g.55204 Transcript_35889/m.55204 type:complete len:238 (+) Transcript_35889:44-757(+)